MKNRFGDMQDMEFNIKNGKPCMSRKKYMPLGEHDRKLIKIIGYGSVSMIGLIFIICSFMLICCQNKFILILAGSIFFRILVLSSKVILRLLGCDDLRIR